MTPNYAIAFNGGSYGNFVFWYLEWLQDKYDLNHRPWGKMNTAHLWDRKDYFISMDELSTAQTPIALIHPRTTKECDLLENLNLILKGYSKIIFLYPTEHTLIWNMNNKYEKVYTGKSWAEYELTEATTLSDYLQKEITINENIKKWQGTELYEIREWLSFFALEQHKAEVEFDTCQIFSNPNILKISVDELRDNFVFVTEKIAKFTSINIVRSKQDILTLYEDWISRQDHKNKDKIVNNIIQGILNQTNVDMTNLTLIDQSEIQRVLRDVYNLEIKCFGLNDWPKSTKELLPLLYKKESNEQN